MRKYLPLNIRNFHAQTTISGLFLPSATVVVERLCFHKRLSFCPRWGEVYTPWPGRHSPLARQTPPGRPPQPGGHPPSQTDTPGQADIPPGQANPPLGKHPPGQTTPWVNNPLARQIPSWQTPPPPEQTATATDGTHPTGMHSCLN